MRIRKEIIRFLAAGAVVNAIDFSIYYFLFHFLPFWMAKGISFACAGVVGYLLNKHWTFKSAHPSYTEVMRFVFINFLALACNVLTNQMILNGWHGAILAALIIASVLTGLFTFVCFKWWVF